MHIAVSKNRSGMVLFIVVAMLALFAVVSVAFYYYALQQLTASRLALDSLRQDDSANVFSPSYADALLQFMLQQLLFGSSDPNSAMNDFYEDVNAQAGFYYLYQSRQFTRIDAFHNRWSDPPNYKRGEYPDVYNVNHGLLRTLFGDQDQVPFAGHFMVWTDPRTQERIPVRFVNPPYTYPDGAVYPFLGLLVPDTNDPSGEKGILLARSFVRIIPHPTSANKWTTVWLGRPPAPPPPGVNFPPGPYLAFGDISGDVRNLPPNIAVRIPEIDPNSGLIKTDPQGNIVYYKDKYGNDSWYGNDSIWVDLGIPMQSLPDGRQFKPFFAFTVLELDGRAHLTVASKVNALSPMLTLPVTLPQRNDLMEVLLRFGDDDRQSPDKNVPPLVYQKRLSVSVPSRDFRYAGFVPSIRRKPWPKADRETVPDFRDPPSPPNPQNPDLGFRFASSLASAFPGSTDTSMPAWPNAPAYTFNGDFEVQLSGNNYVMTGQSAMGSFAKGPSGAYSSKRLNLVQEISNLPAYPAPGLDDPNFNQQAFDRQLATAIAARQKLARKIFYELLFLTGMLDEVTDKPRVVNLANPTDQELQPLRWLAQIAVNIVDYLDPDDQITPFNFYVDRNGFPLASPFDVVYLTDSLGNPVREPIYKYWVFGTEKPSVVVNEVLMEYQESVNAATGNRQDGQVDVRVWVELRRVIRDNERGLNISELPLISLGHDAMRGPVSEPRYQIVVGKRQNSQIDELANQTNGQNVAGLVLDERCRTGRDDFQNAKYPQAGPVPAGTPPPCWTLPLPQPPKWTVPPPDPAIPQPYLDQLIQRVVLGPRDTVENTLFGSSRWPPLEDPANPQNPDRWIVSSTLEFKVVRSSMQWCLPDASGNLRPINDLTDGYVVVLRRLACTLRNRITGTNASGNIIDVPSVLDPTLPGYGQRGWNPDANPLVLNPYISVDYVKVLFGAGLNDRTPDSNFAMTSSQSFGKTISCANLQNQTHQGMGGRAVPDATNNPTKTFHSLGFANPGPAYTMVMGSIIPDNTMSREDDVRSPVHLDRQPNSTLDLLLVSQFKPHLLTQYFLYFNPGIVDWHYAPWLEQQSRLYRFLEFVEALDGSWGSPTSELVQGKVNINTLADPAIFTNLTGGANVDANALTAIQNRIRRQPLVTTRDQPLWGLGFWNLQGNSGGRGMQPTLNTNSHSWIAGTRGAGQVLLGDLRDSTWSSQPQQEQFRSGFANFYDGVTTRSNVFAIWLTIGFFEIVPDPTDPNRQLYQELSGPDGTPVRYRFFAIVDRASFGEWMILQMTQKGIYRGVEGYLGRTDIDPRRTGPNGEPPCVIYWSRIQ
jgi:hypothetical protein